MKHLSLKLKAILISSCAVVAILSFVLWRHYHKGSETEQLPPYSMKDNKKTDLCPSQIETVVMNDKFLPGILEPGQPIKILWNWYACHEPERNDLALIRISRNLPPKIKVIRAVPGDSIKLSLNKKARRWALIVNNAPVLDFQNKPYLFAGEALPPIGRYLKAHQNALSPRDTIALSTRSPGEFDSGLFGIVGGDDLMAKVEPMPTAPSQSAQQ